MSILSKKEFNSPMNKEKSERQEQTKYGIPKL